MEVYFVQSTDMHKIICFCLSATFKSKQMYCKHTLQMNSRKILLYCKNVKMTKMPVIQDELKNFEFRLYRVDL